MHKLVVLPFLKDLLAFDKRVRKLTEKRFKYVCELKYDGASVNLLYEDDKLLRALTRGDGVQGDNITNNIKTISSVPIKLKPLVK